MIDPVTAEQMQKDYFYAFIQSGLAVHMVEDRISPHEMVTAFAKIKQVGLKELRGPSRRHPLVIYRQECMAMLRKKTDLTTSDIGRILNRDHTTVLHALKAVKRRAAQ